MGDDPSLATQDDVVAIERLVTDAYSKYIPLIGKPPSPMLADYRALVSADAVWVAKDGGAVAGVLVLLPRPDHLLLDNVAVAPERQRTGLGRHLIAFAERQSAAWGYADIRLYTHALMDENTALYARLGFEETGRAHQDGYDRVFMRKRLAPVHLHAPIVIRPYVSADHEALARLWFDSWRSAGIELAQRASFAEMRGRIPQALSDGWSVHLAWSGNELAGFLALKLKDSQLDQIFVAPAHQRRGVGKRLLELAKAEMSAGFRLRTAADNHGACRFYEREGLIREGVAPHPRYGYPTAIYRWDGAAAL